VPYPPIEEEGEGGMKRSQLPHLLRGKRGPREFRREEKEKYG